MFYNGQYITNDTLSIITPAEHENGTTTFILTLFNDCKVIFEKEYKSFQAAAMINTRLINKYDLLCNEH